VNGKVLEKECLIDKGGGRVGRRKKINLGGDAKRTSRQRVEKERRPPPEKEIHGSNAHPQRSPVPASLKVERRDSSVQGRGENGAASR